MTVDFKFVTMMSSSQLIIGVLVVLTGLVCKCEGQQQCPPLTFPYNNLCYGVLQYPVQFPKAQFACNVAGGVLATVKDPQSFAFLSQIVQFMMASQYWIGVRQNVTTTTDTNNVSSTWTGAWVYDSTETAINSTFWGPNEPNSVCAYQGGASAKCATAALLSRNLWNNENCSASFGYICQVTSSGSSDVCYKVVDKAATFLEARAACKALNGILAEPKTAKDMLNIVNQLNSNYSTLTSPSAMQPYNGQVVTAGAWALVPEVSNPFISQSNLTWKTTYSGSSGYSSNKGLPACGSCAYLTPQGMIADNMCTYYYNGQMQGTIYGQNYYGLSMNPICVFPPTGPITSACSS
jgi:hypothetical protein